MDERLSIRVSEEQGRVPVVIFHLKGEIDAQTSEMLQDQAFQVIQGGAKDIILDLEDVEYISSAGMRTIHAIFTRLRSDSPGESETAMRKGLMDGSYRSPHLKLLNPSSTVSHVLKTAGFDMYLDIFRSQREAVASF